MGQLLLHPENVFTRKYHHFTLWKFVILEKKYAAFYSNWSKFTVISTALDFGFQNLYITEKKSNIFEKNAIL